MSGTFGVPGISTDPVPPVIEMRDEHKTTYSFRVG